MSETLVREFYQKGENRRTTEGGRRAAPPLSPVTTRSGVTSGSLRQVAHGPLHLCPIITSVFISDCYLYYYRIHISACVCVCVCVCVIVI